MKNIARFGISALMVFGVLIVESSTSSSQTALNNVCVNTKTGSMRYLVKNSKQVCNKTEVKVIWNLTGAAGATGATGVAGAKGATGVAGAKGETGVAGAKGETGVAGAKGETGVAGANGTNATIAITQLSVCDSVDDGTVADELCKIGMTGPGGGHIFFVDYNDQYAGFNYLEAAPRDCEATRAWSSANTAVEVARGWTGSAVGQGQANTTAILAVFTTATSTNNAAKYAMSCTAGSKTDWFLGSIGEMMLMYTNLRQAGVGGFSLLDYWSSSEFGDETAWGQGFALGDQYPGNKVTTASVRPVRAF